MHPLPSHLGSSSSCRHRAWAVPIRCSLLQPTKTHPVPLQQQQQQQPMRRMALLAGALMLAAFPRAAWAAGGNAAVLEDLKRLKKQQRLFGDEDPGSALSTRLEAIQAQLQRCQLLVRIGQYDNARMQLREGAFKSLRMDLGYGQEMYRLVSQQMARDVVEGVERLDGALKRREPPDAISPMIQQLSERVKDVALALDRMDEIR